MTDQIHQIRAEPAGYCPEPACAPTDSSPRRAFAAAAMLAGVEKQFEWVRYRLIAVVWPGGGALATSSASTRLLVSCRRPRQSCGNPSGRLWSSARPAPNAIDRWAGARSTQRTHLPASASKRVGAERGEPSGRDRRLPTDRFIGDDDGVLDELSALIVVAKMSARARAGDSREHRPLRTVR
uniref:Uncharacterized protein n=1 Tax=Plectus sambesii TaxID=2011161 RepID=A0A914V3J1_9BILA